MQTLIHPRNRAGSRAGDRVGNRVEHTVPASQAVISQTQIRPQPVPHPLSVVCAVLTTAPTLDRHTYEHLIAEAIGLYAKGYRTIHIDLQQTTAIAQSGLFALYCVHLIFQGEPLPNTEMGVGALRYVTERVQLDGGQPVCVINVPDHLAPLLARTGFAMKM